MKITHVNVRIMHVPGPGGHSPRRNWIFVFIKTDVGITGVGEATTEYHEQAVASMIEAHLQPMLIGQDPTRIEFLWQQMQRRFWWRGGVVASSAISGVDQALWDITGKAFNQPVYRLLGGAVRDQVRLYARTDLGLDNFSDEVRAASAEGFSAFKIGYAPMKGVFDDSAQVDVTLHAVEQVRQSAGPDLDLMIDCAGVFSLQSAVRLVDGLKSIPMFFVEEPVNIDTPEELARLRQVFPGVRFATGERLTTRWAYRQWLEQQTVDVIQPDISHCGGISELMKIAHYAEVYNVRVAPHNPYGPVALAAAAHACAAMQNFLILEHCRLRPWFDDVQEIGPYVNNGGVSLDERPGLGVDLNVDVIEQHPYQPLPLSDYRDRWGGVPLL